MAKFRGDSKDVRTARRRGGQVRRVRRRRKQVSTGRRRPLQPGETLGAASHDTRRVFQKPVEKRVSQRTIIAAGTDDDEDVYYRLVQEFPLRPIRSEKELSRATEMVDRLSIRRDLEQAEQDYLDVLDGLISQYEDEHHKPGPLSDADFLRELLALHDVTQREVAQRTGIVYTTISSVLAGRRNLTRDQIGVLARYFRIPVASFSFEPMSRSIAPLRS